MLTQFYLRLQLLRSNRWLRYLGIEPLLAYILIPILLFGFVKLCYFKTQYALFIISFIATLIMLKLSSKERNDFLKTIFPKVSFYKLRIKENIFLALPFTLCMAFHRFEILTLLPIILAIGLAFYNSHNSIITKIPTPFSKSPFEFIVGFRQYLLAFLFLYIIFAMALYVGNYNLAVAMYGSLFLIIITFYTQMEEYFFVWIHSQSPKAFLINKIKIGLFYSSIIMSLGLIILLIIYPHFAWITILVTLVGLGNVILSIVMKYAQYPNMFKLINIIIQFISVGFPFFLPITIPYYYKKALYNMRIELL